MDDISKINKFLESDEDYSFLIEGKWGVGKTYLWKEIQEEQEKFDLAQKSVFTFFVDNCKKKFSFKNHFKSLIKFVCKITVMFISWLCYYCGFCDNQKYKEKVRKFVYISLFGKEHYEQVLEEVLLKAYTRNRILLFFKRMTLYGVSVGSMLSLLKEDDLKNVVVCFDDIERKSDYLKIKDFLGLVLQLKEEKQCKVVLLLNTEELREFEKKIFDSYKEKVIDSTIELTNVKEVIRVILDNKLKDTDIDMDLMPDNVYRITNLRNLKKIINGFKIFYKELNLLSLSQKTDDYKELIQYLFECIVDVVNKTNEPKNQVIIGYRLSKDSRHHIKSIVEKCWKDYEFKVTQMSKEILDDELKKHKIYKIRMNLQGIRRNLIKNNLSNEYIQFYEKNILSIENEIKDFADIMLYEFIDFMALVKVMNSKNHKIKSIEKEIRKCILHSIDGATEEAIDIICDGDKNLKEMHANQIKSSQNNDITWTKNKNLLNHISINSYSDFLAHLDELECKNKYTVDKIKTFFRNRIICFYVKCFLKYPKNEKDFKNKHLRLYKIWDKIQKDSKR